MSLEKLTTVVSSTGQVVLPNAVREHRDWAAGTRLIVEDTEDGVLLRLARRFPATMPTQVFASLPFAGAAKTVEEMDAGILAEAKLRHARD